MSKIISKQLLVKRILLFTSILLTALTFVIIAFSDFNPNAIIHENIYLWLSTKRDAEVFTVYRDSNSILISIDQLQEISDFSERVSKARELGKKVDATIQDIDQIQKKYDKKLLELGVSDTLANQAINYDITDSSIKLQLNSAKEYLESEIIVNEYLLAKGNIIACYQDVSSQASQATITAIKNCIAQNKLVQLPDSVEYAHSNLYQTELTKYLEANLVLHKYLVNEDSENAEKQKAIVINRFKELGEISKEANQMLEALIVDKYNEFYNK